MNSDSDEAGLLAAAPLTFRPATSAERMNALQSWFSGVLSFAVGRLITHVEFWAALVATLVGVTPTVRGRS